MNKTGEEAPPAQNQPCSFAASAASSTLQETTFPAGKNRSDVVLAVGLAGALVALLCVLQLLDAQVIWVAECGIVILATTLVLQYVEWRKQAASLRSLTQKKQRLATAVEGGSLGVLEWDVDAGQVHGDESWFVLLGGERRDQSLTIAELAASVHPADLPGVHAAVGNMLRGKTQTCDVEHRVQTLQGDSIWVRSRGKVVKRADDGRVQRIFIVVADIGDHAALREAQDTLENRERQLRLITDSMPALIAYVNAEERLVFHNRAYYKRFGQTGQSAIGRSLREILGEPLYRRTRKHVQLALNGTEASFRSFYRTWDGVRRADRVRLMPHIAEGGKVLGVYALLIDVTEQWRSEEKLKEALDQANNAARARNAFLATVSHELRTPLNAIIGFNSLMMEKNCSPEERGRYLSFARDAGQALLTQVNDLLDMAKIEAGKMEFESVDFDLAQLIETSVNVIRSQAQLRGLDVGTEISAELGRWVQGDPTRLRQILFNLLNNALKFTEQGSIHVSARPVGEQMVEISVADTGVGIPAGRLEAIFEKFSQADVSITRRFGGTGLGLAICRSLAQLMGGEISVESTQDSGSIFRVTVPLHEALAPVAVAAPLRGARTGRILVVEDQEANSVLAKALLEDMGHQVELAANGSEALDRLLQERFDVVLMDLEMPVMGGLEATRRIRTMTHPARNIPVIAMSASVYATDIASCRAAGMVEHIAKPIGREALIRTLDRWLPERRMRTRNANPSPADSPLGKLVAMVGQASAVQVAKAFETALVKRLDLFRAERLDLPAIKIEAHNLAGISTTLGFGELAETARLIEDRIRHGESVEELMPHLIAGCEAAEHVLRTALTESAAG